MEKRVAEIKKDLGGIQEVLAVVVGRLMNCLGKLRQEGLGESLLALCVKDGIRDTNQAWETINTGLNEEGDPQ